MNKVAYIIDGGFFTKKFSQFFKVFPTADDTEKYIHSIHDYINKNILKYPAEIYRIFFYDCSPSKDTLINPVNSKEFNFTKSKTYKNNIDLQNNLRNKNYFALRFGELKIKSKDDDPWIPWQINSQSMKELLKRKLQPKDIFPLFNQKGVDMRIGLDIASITSKKLCTQLVLISGDTDMIPAMKTARKEGTQVFLHSFSRGIPKHLSPHSDYTILHKDLSYEK